MKVEKHKQNKKEQNILIWLMKIKFSSTEMPSWCPNEKKEWTKLWQTVFFWNMFKIDKHFNFDFFFRQMQIFDKFKHWWTLQYP